MDQDQDPAKAWSDLRFRRQPSSREDSDPAWTRFWLGLAFFLLVAIAYPWYSYFVQSRLLATDMAAAATQISKEAEAELRRMNAEARQQREATQLAREDARQSAEINRHRREAASVRVMGHSASGDNYVMIVDLGQSNIIDARDRLCREARHRFNQTSDLPPIRVQRYRQQRPAVDVGVLQCG